SNNALILLDEIDKLGRDYKGDPAAALLEVLDGEQNSTFTDHYIELPYDLSKIVFIATANSVDTIPPALFDRLEIIELSSYTREEKFNIAKKFLIKRQLQKHGLTAKDCKITDDAIYAIIDGYTRESGVRLLERQIATLCRKAVKAIVKDNATKLVIKATDLHQLIGPQKYSADLIEKNDEVGLVNGLAWTSVGGELLPLEVCVMEGTGKIELTGCLGDVMKESARAAITFIRANANVLGVDSDFYKTKDIHIHAPENAVPKDGPSAGVTITTAIVSALTGKKVRRDIAMTGEVTIRGRVLKIGGLREKAMAAHRSGINTVFIPKENVADLSQLDDTVRTQLNFVPVQNVTEILNDAFVHENLTDEKSDAFSSKINFIPEKSVIRSTAQ
ncbi:MAG: AAA family ATPase, partial [Clostridia bacterium]|nr:AAA family ATPase [Clostridia bacterium]